MLGAVVALMVALAMIYTGPASDRRALLRAQIEQRPGAALVVMTALPLPMNRAPTTISRPV